MTRQAWIFIGVMGTFAVLAIAGIAVAAALFSLEDDDTASRCRHVPDTMLAAIEEGMQPGMTLSNAQAVQSRDYDRVYMIAADVEGLGEPGIWASNRLGPGGVIYAVNGVAREFSDWGNGPGLSVTDDGVDEAIKCQ